MLNLLSAKGNLRKDIQPLKEVNRAENVSFELNVT
jgi:hypothetical protein